MSRSAIWAAILCGVVIVPGTGLSQPPVSEEIRRESNSLMARLNKLPNTTTSSANRESLTTQTRTVKVGEDGMRRAAIKVVMPVYPKVSIKNRKSGVGVAEVLHDGEGNVVKVTVLESPDAECSKSITSALKQWKFAPSKVEGAPVNVRGKLTFYFVIDNNGRGEVRPPKQFS